MQSTTLLEKLYPFFVFRKELPQFRFQRIDAFMRRIQSGCKTGIIVKPDFKTGKVFNNDYFGKASRLSVFELLA